MRGVLLLAGVYDISRPGAACRTTDHDDRRLRTNCADADARVSSAERRQRRRTLVLSVTRPYDTIQCGTFSVRCKADE